MNRRGNPLMTPGRRTFLSLVDIILFALDARIPRTSIRVAKKYLHPRKFVYVLTRIDLADPVATRDWIAAFESQGKPAFAVQANTGEGMKKLVAFLEGERERVNRSRPPGTLEKPLKLMVFGLPNVGKSSIINRLSGRVRAPAGGKPGLTRGIHWIRCGEEFLLLDTPGVLEPGAVKGDTLMALAATGAIPETRYDPVGVALWLVERVSPATLGAGSNETGFRVRFSAGREPTEMGCSADSRMMFPGEPTVLPDEAEPPARPALLILEEFGREAGQVKKGGEVDLTRASQLCLARFRKGEFGAITLELPGDDGIH